jgi:TolA-binding protein
VTEKSSLAISVAALVEQLIEIRTKIQQLNQDIESTNAVLEKMTKQRDQLLQELTQGKKLISDCINTGRDPIEAKLVGQQPLEEYTEFEPMIISIDPKSFSTMTTSLDPRPLIKVTTDINYESVTLRKPYSDSQKSWS